MDVMEVVVLRLKTLGYEVQPEDKAVLEYLIAKCQIEILSNIHHKDLPDGLIPTLADMVAGYFLYDKKAMGTLDIDGLDLGPAKEIKEGDVTVTMATSSDGETTTEQAFDDLLDRMMHPTDLFLAAWRKLRW